MIAISVFHQEWVFLVWGDFGLWSLLIFRTAHIRVLCRTPRRCFRAAQAPDVVHGGKNEAAAGREVVDAALDFVSHFFRPAEWQHALSIYPAAPEGDVPCRSLPSGLVWCPSPWPIPAPD